MSSSRKMGQENHTKNRRGFVYKSMKTGKISPVVNPFSFSLLSCNSWTGRTKQVYIYLIFIRSDLDWSGRTILTCGRTIFGPAVWNLHTVGWQPAENLVFTHFAKKPFCSPRLRSRTCRRETFQNPIIWHNKHSEIEKFQVRVQNRSIGKSHSFSPILVILRLQAYPNTCFDQFNLHTCSQLVKQRFWSWETYSNTQTPFGTVQKHFKI